MFTIIFDFMYIDCQTLIIGPFKPVQKYTQFVRPSSSDAYDPLDKLLLTERLRTNHHVTE